MSLYIFDSVIANTPLRSFRADDRVTIACKVSFLPGANEYDFNVTHVRVEKRANGALTGRFLVVPTDYIEDIFKTDPVKLGDFMEEKYKSKELEIMPETHEGDFWRTIN